MLDSLNDQTDQDHGRNLLDLNSCSVDGHEANKFIGYETIGSFSWITDLVSISIKVSGRGAASFVRPVSIIVQSVPMVIFKTSF